MTLRKLAAAALIVAGSAAQAQLVFSDNFDSNATALNGTPALWSVSPGTVDIIGDTAPLFDFLPGNGNYIDLDGSTFNAGVLSRSFSLTGGTEYVASFQLAGNQRNADSETVTVKFETTTQGYSLAMADPFTSYSLRFTPGSDAVYSISFANAGGDNIGMLLDNVSVYAVPEPETYALLLAGLAAMCFVVRRRMRYES